MQRLSARDEFIDRDLLGFTIDPGGQGHFAYWFMVALGGSVLDGKALPERRFQNDWDGPWHSATARLSHGWSAEMMLPWSMMGLPRTQGERTMGFAFSRYVAHAGQRYQPMARPHVLVGSLRHRPERYAGGGDRAPPADFDHSIRVDDQGSGPRRGEGPRGR